MIDVVIKIVDVLPETIACLLILVLGVMYREPLKKRLGDVTGFKFAGLELQFKEVAEKLGTAVARAPEPVRASQAQQDRAVRRLEENADRLKGATLLWVDDNPSNNSALIELFRSTDVSVDLAHTTADAKKLIERHGYHVVISDIHRIEDEVEQSPAGLELLAWVSGLTSGPPTIIYTGNANHSPPRGSFGYTARPDEVIHLVVDALARVR